MSGSGVFSAELEDLFDDLVHAPWNRGEESLWSPPIDVYETSEGFWITVDLPGAQRQNIKLRRIGSCSVLLLGTRSRACAAQSGQYLVCERNWCRFRRRIDLHYPITVPDTCLEVENGICRLFLPKLPTISEWPRGGVNA